MICRYFLLFSSCLFTVLIVSPGVQKFKFWCSSIYLFLFFTLCFGIISKKLLPNPMSWNFSPMFSYKSFIILGLMFQCLIHQYFCILWSISTSVFLLIFCLLVLWRENVDVIDYICPFLSVLSIFTACTLKLWC